MSNMSSDVVISVSFDNDDVTFKRCRRVLSFFYHQYLNIKPYFYRSAPEIKMGEVYYDGDSYLVGGGLLLGNYEENYQWSDDQIRENNQRDRIFLQWLLDNQLNAQHFLAHSVTSIYHPKILQKIIDDYRADELYMGKLVELEGGAPFLSGAGVLYSRKVLSRMLERSSPALDVLFDDIRNGAIMRDTGKLPATRLDVFDSRHFLSDVTPESGLSGVLRDVISDGYYHIRLKYFSPSQRASYDPLLMLAIANFFLELNNDSEYVTKCINLLLNEAHSWRSRLGVRSDELTK